MEETPQGTGDDRNTGNTENTEQQPPREPVQTIEKPKNKSTKWVAYVALLVLLAIAGAGSFFLLSSDESSDEKNVTVSEQQNTSELSKVELVDDTEAQELGAVVFFAENTERYVAVDADNEKSLSANLVKKDVASTIDYTRLFEELVATYFDGHTQVEAFDADKYTTIDNASKYERYENDTSACTIRLTWLEDAEGNVVSDTVDAGTVAIMCADFDKVDEVAEFMEPFYVAYYEANEDVEETQDPESSIIISIKKDAIESGDTPGYEKARGGIGSVVPSGGASVVFAREDGGQWEFVLAQQDVASCSDNFKTVVAQRALADTICADGTQEPENWPTVGQYYNL